MISIKLQSILAWVFSHKFVPYFQDTFSYEHLQRAAQSSFFQIVRLQKNLEKLWVLVQSCKILSFDRNSSFLRLKVNHWGIVRKQDVWIYAKLLKTKEQQNHFFKIKWKHKITYARQITENITFYISEFVSQNLPTQVNFLYKIGKP